MHEPKVILAVGDLHGDPKYTQYAFEQAAENGCDAIVQCGDFGYWEHMPGGDAFLDWCSILADTHGVPFYWLDGNHENHSLLRAQYGPGGPKHELTPEGFWKIRDNVFYIPRGTRWTWSGKTLMGLGGAYSVDKFWRIKRQNKRRHDHAEANHYREAAGKPKQTFNPWRWQEWWPEEELTDDEVQATLANPEPIDILFTHDKPRGSNPAWNRKDISECWPNQDRISTVVNALHPKLLVHGHLHYRYRDTIPCGDGVYCVVEGLNCNVNSRDPLTEQDPTTGLLVVYLDDSCAEPDDD